MVVKIFSLRTMSGPDPGVEVVNQSGIVATIEVFGDDAQSLVPLGVLQ